MEEIKIFYAMFYFLAFIGFIFLVKQKKYNENEIIIEKDKDGNEIIIEKDKDGIFIKRRKKFFFSDKEKIYYLFGPFPTKKNLLLQLDTLKSTFPKEVIEKIKSTFPKEVLEKIKTEI